MARGREFNEGEVLRRAMHTFRARGYGKVSIPELEAATGISSGSLYNSYGDKHGIFLASFTHYLSSVLDRRVQRYAGASKGLSGLRQLFLSLLDEPNGENFGCLITNTAIEFGADNALLAATVQKGFGTLEQLFAERLADKPHPQLAAVRLLALYQGVLVLFRAGYDPKKIRRTINLEFDAMQEETK
ncbi:MAG: hypothetical protein A4S14_16500 [Proteobacteria bacterium SG_bin9]|nr:MAG: hypothetical protein A4S14_16500 [Proteobacteria bacterium SG_bin9]